MEENVGRMQEIRDAVKAKMGERRGAVRQRAMGCRVVCVDMAGAGSGVFSVAG